MNLIAQAGPSALELGTRIGQAQAFRWMAKRSSAAGARQLKQIKEDRSYESLGLNWEQFCVQHAGLSRAYADRLIKRLDEFGEPYFQLSGIARVSPESYRLLAPAVTAEGIEVDGESIPLTPENRRVFAKPSSLCAPPYAARSDWRPIPTSPIYRFASTPASIR